MKLPQSMFLEDVFAGADGAIPHLIEAKEDAGVEGPVRSEAEFVPL